MRLQRVAPDAHDAGDGLRIPLYSLSGLSAQLPGPDAAGCRHAEPTGELHPDPEGLVGPFRVLAFECGDAVTR